MGTATTFRRKRAKALPSVEIREMELRDVPQVFELGEKLFLDFLQGCHIDDSIVET